jgi:hypothetical protein
LASLDGRALSCVEPPARPAPNAAPVRRIASVRGGARDGAARDGAAHEGGARHGMGRGGAGRSNAARNSATRSVVD